MEIYVDTEHVKPKLINEIPEDIKEKILTLFLTPENIEKLKNRCNDNKYKGIIFDSSPKDPLFYMYPIDLTFEEVSEDNSGIHHYKPENNSLEETVNSIHLLLSHNDFNIVDLED